jgi:hypothetical protein
MTNKVVSRKSLGVRELVEIVVMPGDWGKRFQPGESQRSIRAKWARVLARYMPAVQESSGALVLSPLPCAKNERPSYIVLDGQHRIYAASEVLKKPVRFYAEIRHEVRDTQEAVRNLNRQMRHNLGDSLEVTRRDSPWPEIFAEYGLDLSYRQKRTDWCWPVVLRAFTVDQWALESGGPMAYRTNVRSNEQCIDVWKNAKPSDIRDFAEFLLWWSPAMEHGKKIRLNMGTYDTLMIMWRIYQENPESYLKGLPKKVMRYPEIERLRGSNAAQLSNTIRLLLAAVNYKNQTRLLTFCGRTGRDDLL